MKTVFQVSREIWVSKATGVSSDWLVPEVRMDQRARRVVRAPMVKLVPWALQEKRANLVFRDYLAIRDVKGQRVRPVSPDSQEPTERKEPGVWQENPVQGDKEVQRVHVGVVVLEVQQENQALRAQQAMMAHLVHLVREDPKGPRVLLVSQGQKAPLDHLERTGCPVTLASAERRDSKAKLGHLDQEVLSGLRVQQERLAPLVREDILDPLVLLESKVFQVLLEKKVQREIQVLRAVLEKTDLQG